MFVSIFMIYCAPPAAELVRSAKRRRFAACLECLLGNHLGLVLNLFEKTSVIILHVLECRLRASSMFFSHLVFTGTVGFRDGLPQTFGVCFGESDCVGQGNSRLNHLRQ